MRGYSGAGQHPGGALAAELVPKAKEAQLWDDNWRTVYELAEASMARSMDEFMR